MNNQKDSSPRRGRMSDKLRKRLKDSLKPLFQYVSTHEELDLQLRDNYFNVYYNGGNALRVTPTGLFLDPWYFYTGEYNGVKIPKTYIEEQCKNKPRHKQPRNYPSKELAREIYGWMKSIAATILGKAEKGDFKAYFEELKPVMDNWVTMYNREERKRQHIISCSNRDFTPDNNLVVIDIEFAVSKNKPYNHAVNENGNQKMPKMDIIAVDKDGQLYSIELKNNLEADAEDSAQNVENHLKDFNNTLGWPEENDFAQEMSEVVKMKQELGILGNEVFVDTTHIPLFAIAYSGDIPEESAEFKHRHKGLTMVDLTKENNGSKIYLKLNK